MDVPSLAPPTPGSTKKAKRERKPKTKPSEPAVEVPATAGWNVNAEAGSSKQPAVVSVVPATSGDETVPTPATGVEKRGRRPKKVRDETSVKAKSKSKAKAEAKRLKQAEAASLELKKTWECVPLAQSEVSRIPPVWTRDGRFYITAQNTSIHIHSSSAPYAHKSTLVDPNEKGHKAPITTLLLSPLNPAHIVTAAEDGMVKIWDWESGSVIHNSHVVNGKVLQMCIGEVAGRWEVFATLSINSSKKGGSLSFRLVRFPYPTSFPMALPPVQRMGKLAAPPTALFISPSSLYLVALAANKAYTYLLPTSSTTPEWTAQLVKFVTDQALTCGAFAPTDKLTHGSKKGEDWFATGDEKGVIRLWHGLGQAFRLLSGGKRDAGKPDPGSEKRLPTTSLHWHAHAVAALAFTPSGSQLLSVGEESVLVQWHLGSGKREYIPRLGGRPIVSLAVRKAAARGQEEEWWMAFADGSVVKVGAGSGKVENVGQGVKIDPLRQVEQSTPYPLTLHSSTSALVLPSSNPGTLQFINPTQTSLLFDLEVAPSNRVSRRDEKHLIPVAVELVAFSDTVGGQSEWMATVEGRKGDEWEGGGEVRNLKIWRWDGQRYLVNTQFPKPHGPSEITSLAFSPLNTPTSPDLPYLLTSAIDGTAKLWHIRQSRKSEHGKAASKKPATFELFWASRSSWAYRSLPIHSACFSPDATIIALAHGASSLVSLWDVESNVLLRALDASADLKDVRQLAFVGEEGRWVAAAGQGGVVCWDLLSCQKTLFAPAQNIISLLPIPYQNGFITANTLVSSTVISLFSPTSSTPSRSITIPRIVRTLTLLPSSRSSHKSDHLNFAAVSPSGDLFRLGDDVSTSQPLSSSLAITPTAAKGKLSIWQEMFGEHAFLNPEEAEAESSKRALDLLDRKALGKGRAAAIAVYDGPSHTLPPAHLLFDGFMECILASGPSGAVDEAEEQGIKYEQGGMEGVEESLPEGRMKERGVGAEEVKELEGFFRDLFKGGGGVNKGKARAPNGLGHVVGEEEEAGEEGMEIDAVKPNGVGRKVNGVQGTPSKKEEAVEEDRVVVSAGGAAGGKKGKKRRAPKDSA